MNLLTRSRDELRHTVGLHAAWDSLPDLQDRYAAASTEEERRTVGAEIADTIEACADLLNTSTLARAVTMLDVADLRRSVPEWRVGTMCVGP